MVVIPSSHRCRRRILFLSLEFNFSPFSGNGVFARSLVSGLLDDGGGGDDDDDDDDDDGGDVRVRVVCARPHPSAPGASDDVDIHDVVLKRRRRGNDEPPEDEGEDDGRDRLQIWPVDLPEGCAWKRLDRSGPWRQYSSMMPSCSGGGGGGYDGGGASIAEKVGRFRPTDVVAVDWHGMLAWEQIVESCSRPFPRPRGGSQSSSSWHPSRDRVSVLYFNFRVYSSSEWGRGPSSPPPGGGGREEGHDDDDDGEDVDDNAFYRAMERRACLAADAVVCVSENDRSALRALMREDNDGDCDGDDDDNDNDGHRRRGKERDVHVLHPPLRGDIRKLAMGSRHDGDSHDDDDDEYGENGDECNERDGESGAGGGRRRASLDRFLPPEARFAVGGRVGGDPPSSSSTATGPTSPTATASSSPPPRRGRRGRAFVTCVVRLSPEKSPCNFVPLLRRLGGVGFLRRHGLVPLMCGARSVEGYAGFVVEDLRRLVSSRRSSSSEGGDEEVGEDVVVNNIVSDDDDDAWPCVVLDRHIGAEELAAIFSRTVINVHVSVEFFVFENLFPPSRRIARFFERSSLEDGGGARAPMFSLDLLPNFVSSADPE
jgi:hypothetical protein